MWASTAFLVSEISGYKKNLNKETILYRYIGYKKCFEQKSLYTLEIVQWPSLGWWVITLGNVGLASLILGMVSNC